MFTVKCGEILGVYCCTSKFPYRPWGGRGRGAGQGHDFLDGQAELEPVQGIADANFPLDFRVRQGWHDSTTFHIGSAGSHVPGWHPHPQLEYREGSQQDMENIPASKPTQSLQVCMFRGLFIHFGSTTHLQPHHHSGPIPLCKRQTLSSGFLQQLVPTITETVISHNGCDNSSTALTSLSSFQ